MKVTVVGAGIMGLSTAWALVHRGHAVTVFEQGPIPNPFGSSVDQHRLIRYPYGPERGYTRMVGEAYRAWDELWTDLGERLYVPTGTLVLGSRREGWGQDSAACLESLGVRFEWLDPEAIERCFPLLSAEGLACGFHLESGGVLLAGRIVEALARHLRARGVTLVASTRVASVDPDAARVVISGGAAVEADRLVIAAGAWAPPLVPSLAGRVTPSRQVVAYIDPPPDLLRQWHAAPMVLDIDPEVGLYLVPPVLGTGLKVGNHRFSLSGDPDQDREATEAEARAVYDLCRPRLRDFERYRLAGARTCFYTVEPRERFIVEPLGRAFLVSACSGHGFKFGSIVGMRVAEAIDGRRDPAELARWAAGEA